LRAIAPLALRTRASALLGVPCVAVVAWLAWFLRVSNPAVDETAKTPAIASPARLRKLFRFVVGLLSMRRKIDMLKVPLNAMANVFSQLVYTDFVDF
jgi:hypothetical protein